MFIQNEYRKSRKKGLGLGWRLRWSNTFGFEQQIEGTANERMVDKTGGMEVVSLECWTDFQVIERWIDIFEEENKSEALKNKE